ncbi:hypothetical protein bcgnr5371_05560 [Bacillus cereus]
MLSFFAWESSNYKKAADFYMKSRLFFCLYFELKKGISDFEREGMLKITILKYDEVSVSFMDKKVHI